MSLHYSLSFSVYIFRDEHWCDDHNDENDNHHSDEDTIEERNKEYGFGIRNKEFSTDEDQNCVVSDINKNWSVIPFDRCTQLRSDFFNRVYILTNISVYLITMLSVVVTTWSGIKCWTKPKTQIIKTDFS